MKQFFFYTTDINRATYKWNLIYSLIFGFQSVIILVVLTRTVGIDDAGIFTIAYANASLFLLGAKYGVRNYQVSDIKNEYGFVEYLQHRWISVSIMSILELIYIIGCTFTKEYSVEKTWIMILVCLLKVPDAIEDVYAGEYQKQGRLDIAAKMMAVRLMISTIILMGIALITRNLILSVSCTVIVSVVLLGIGIFWSSSYIPQVKSSHLTIKMIFVNCFPLFLGTFLNQYINNAPKYAIDSVLSDALQASYGFIAMPVFVIGLLNNVIFAPVIHGMAKDWDSGKKEIFKEKFTRQSLIVTGITGVVLLGAWIAGVPVLSILYNTDLTEYKQELLILLLSGGFLAMSGVLNTVITIIRFQKYLPYGYLFVALLAFFGSTPVVRNFGITGIAVYYMLLTAILAFIFGVMFMVGYRKSAV